MNRFEDLIFPYDLARMPRERLVDVLRSLDLSTDGPIDDLARRLFDYARKNNSAWVLSPTLSYAFGGMTSISWFRPTREGLLEEAVRVFRATNKEYYSSVTFGNPDTLGAEEAQLLGAAHGNFMGQEVDLIRLLVKVRDSKVNIGTSVERRPVTAVGTVIITTQEPYVEVRADSAAVGKMLSAIPRIVGLTEDNLRRQTIAPFVTQLEIVAERLNGTLLGTISKPENFIERLSDAQLQAILSLLDGVGAALVDPDGIDLAALVEQTQTVLIDGGLNVSELSLSSLMLAGLDLISLKAGEKSDAREGPLYRWSRPGIQHHGGAIRFPVQDDDGETRPYTVRLGAITQSVAFHSKASEAAIRKVRETLFRLEDELWRSAS